MSKLLMELGTTLSTGVGKVFFIGGGNGHGALKSL